MINRAALILKYKQPAIDWINSSDPSDNNPGITESEVNDERTIYLIGDEVADTPDSLDLWLKNNFVFLFESELDSWYTDPDLWPQNRNYELFKSWFTLECNTVVIDTVGTPIYDDEI